MRDEYQIQNSYGLWLPTDLHVWRTWPADRRRVVRETREVIYDAEVDE